MEFEIQLIIFDNIINKVLLNIRCIFFYFSHKYDLFAKYMICSFLFSITGFSFTYITHSMIIWTHPYYAPHIHRTVTTKDFIL